MSSQRRRFVVCSLSFWIFVPLFFLSVANQIHADLREIASDVSPEELKLLEEYRTQYPKIKECYNNIRMDAVHRTSYFRHLKTPGNPEGKEATRLVYRANGGEYFRMDDIDLDRTSELPTGGKLVRLVRPEGYATLHRNTADKPLAIRNLDPRQKEGVTDLSGNIFQWAPFSNYVVSLKWFILRKPHGFATSYKIEKVETSEAGDAELVTITTHAIMESGDADLTGRFVFFRNKGWVLKEYFWGHIDPPDSGEFYSRKASYEYEGEYNGIGLLKRVDYWEELGPTRRKDRVESFEIVNVEPGPVPLDEFTLEAITLSDVAPQRNNWTTRLYVLLAGVACIAIYVVLRRRSEAA